MKPGTEEHTGDPSTWRWKGSEVQAHPWLQREFAFTLGSKELHLKKRKYNKTLGENGTIQGKGGRWQQAGLAAGGKALPRSLKSQAALGMSGMHSAQLRGLRQNWHPGLTRWTFIQLSFRLSSRPLLYSGDRQELWSPGFWGKHLYLLRRRISAALMFLCPTPQTLTHG